MKLFTRFLLPLFFLFTIASAGCGTEETCIDGIQNQDETGVDCGGVCQACVSCSDGIMNGNETGVDCGGDCPNTCTIVANLQTYTTTNSDIPDNYIYDLEWSGSNLWVATDEGAATFDGSTWTTYNTGNSDLPHNEVRDILVGSLGEVWFATWGGGVARLDNGTWTVWNSSVSGTPSEIDYADHLVSTFNWTVVGALGEGFLIWDGSTWTPYTPANSDLTTDQITGIAAGSNFELYISTLDQGLLRFDVPNFTGWNSGNSDLPDNELYSVHHAGNGDLWIGSKAGLVWKSGTSFTTYGAANSEIRGDVVQTFSIDSDDKLWFHALGLSSFDGTTWTHFNAQNSSDDLFYANDVLVDVNGTHWVGTQDGGLISFE